MSSSAGSDGRPVDEVKSLVLYGYPGCPYCRRVLSAIASLGIEIPLRNTMTDDANNADLVAATGRETVPVLRIEMQDGSVRWLPESLDIVRFLNERYAGETRAN